jgi:hypothetical protein
VVDENKSSKTVKNKEVNEKQKQSLNSNNNMTKKELSTAKKSNSETKNEKPNTTHQAAVNANPNAKRKVIVDYKNVPEEVLMLLHEKYPHGYNRGIIKFTNAKNEVVSAVPIELGNTSYLVKVSTQLQKMVDDIDIDDDDVFAAPVLEKEVPVGAVADLDEFDKSDDDDDKPKKSKAKGKVGSADDLEYGFDDDDDDDDVDDDDDDDDDDDYEADDDDDDDE